MTGDNDYPIVYVSSSPFDADDATTIVGAGWAVNVTAGGESGG
jgi:hypothetical protein